MAILVTRPQPDNAATVAALRAKGFEVLPAPMLRFEPVAFELDEADAPCEAVIVTSASALRAFEGKTAAVARLSALPLFAVGERTAQAARDIGFRNVISADGDAAVLRDLVAAQVRAKTLTKAATLLYLAGADLARDLAGELGARGFNVVTQTTYRMAAITRLPDDVCAAFAAQGIEAVLHYSRRSARAFLDAARAGGVEISALAVPQCCLSEAIAAIVRDAGATQVMVAAMSDEKALFAALDRALSPVSR
jgi:uroporphyrinogen-III synthase